MQDLAQIRRQNGNAISQAVPDLVSQGRHVVAYFYGLNYSGHKAFDTREEADAFASQKEKELGVSVRAYSPEPVEA